MYLHTAYILSTGLALSYAQTRTLSVQQPQASAVSANSPNYWCGDWAGHPEPTDVPAGQQLPQVDVPDPKRFFVEPQLTSPPFQPLMAKEPKVQIPKFWGNNNFRLALLSYKEDQPAVRMYSSSKSRWSDIFTAINMLMDTCVIGQHVGGAYLVPPSPGLTQSTLVVYAYETGSKFDFEMNYYTSNPYGINPALAGLSASLGTNTSSLLETMYSNASVDVM